MAAALFLVAALATFSVYVLGASGDFALLAATAVLVVIGWHTREPTPPPPPPPFPGKLKKRKRDKKLKRDKKRSSPSDEPRPC